MSYRKESLERTVKHRNLPAGVTIGSECEMAGSRGIIVGGDHSGRLAVLFDKEDHVGYCHPGYLFRIFNERGGVMYESDDLYTKPCPDCGKVQPIECKAEHVCPD